MNTQLQLFTSNETLTTLNSCSSIRFFIHRLSGEKLKLIKIYGNCVAKCERENEIIIFQNPYLSIKTAICHINNLIPLT